MQVTRIMAPPARAAMTALVSAKPNSTALAPTLAALSAEPLALSIVMSSPASRYQPFSSGT